VYTPFLGAHTVTVPTRKELPTTSAKNDAGEDFASFKNFMRRLVAVPHSEIKKKLDAEKRKKARKKRAKISASRVPASV
jgi:hypothetical protein